MKPVTEGIIKAEGLTWYQVVVALMKVIMPWKGKLTATFILGVARVVSFIGIGVLSALIVLALKNHQPYGGLAIALAILAPLSGILHWFESWLAHDMAFRLLAEMRIDAFRKLDALAPAYLTRRRTGDLDGAGHARHRAGRVLLRPHRGAGLRRHPGPRRRGDCLGLERVVGWRWRWCRSCWPWACGPS